MTEVTRLLSDMDAGDPHASEKLLPLVYEELRRLAAAKLAKEKAGHTLQPTALVHEAYIRLVGGDQPWDSRAHFFGAAAEAMRRILVDQARRKRSEKHGGGRKRLELGDADFATNVTPERLLALDEALSGLADEDPTAASLAKLRVFGGLSLEQAAGGLGLSRASAYRHWAYARAWLRAELAD